MTTETDIANLALDVLKEAPIGSLDDARPIARWLKRNFAVARDSTLVSANWNFAIRRVELPADSADPIFGWRYSYTQPSDCLRVIPLTQCGALEGDPIAYEVEAGKILTNAPPRLRVRYIFRNENYGVYPAPFQEALAGRLALKMAHWMTGKSSFVEIARRMYDDAMETAWLTDAIQGTAPRAADREWIESR